MSPPGTMARVYRALKERVTTGGFLPGERIDPARLSPAMCASATPIREALHRLAGERLVESWQHEGFRQPIVTEAALRDLYGWSDDLLRLLLRVAQRGGPQPIIAPLLPAEFAVAAGIAFDWLAAFSPNAEHRIAVASLNERSHAIRIVEARLIPDTGADLTAFTQAATHHRWSDARRILARYHAARLRRLSDIAAHFQRRES